MAFRVAIGPCKCRPAYREAIQELAKSGWSGVIPRESPESGT
jgi:hypothetical protein